MKKSVLAGAFSYDPLVLFALFVFRTFCNPFFAVDRGSLIYIGRALADLDPSGVSQDIMFRYDGQSSFTLFTPIFRLAAAALGISLAAYITAAASVVASFVGAVVFASSISIGRMRYLVIAFATALPAYYGGYKLFSYAETAATPRPFAEALVLCDFAAQLKRNYGLSLLLMIAATLLHPIMALPGLAVLVLWIMGEKHLVAVFIRCALIIAAFIVAAFTDTSVLNRLTSIVDPEWRTALIDRNPHLFPSLWLNGWIGRAVVRTATILIAAGLVSYDIRRFFLIAIFIGDLGLAGSFFLGEHESMLIVIQAQTWRMMWLIFAIGAVAAAICVMGLWSRGGIARIVLSLLALSWVWADYDAPAALLAVTAFVVHYTVDPKEYTLRKEIVWGILVGVAALLVAGLVHQQLAIREITETTPSGFADEGRQMLALQYDYTPLAVIASVWAITNWPQIDRLALGVFTGLAAIVVFPLWDQRSSANKYFDSGKGVPDLESMLADKSGEIYWVDGLRENWWWLHRPNWVTSIQGAGIVFSRDLALLYTQRVRRALDFGLAREDLATPFQSLSAPETLMLTQHNVQAFCAFPDAPAWIITPIDKTTDVASDIAAGKWTSPIVQLKTSLVNGSYHWDRMSEYAVISCAK